ncbi:HD domain-containing protein [Bombilactobacillus bombi]|uniref:HD domain-containing protein n=1 Tax=Bombilactobacillus bombi TaxID=1303590 RepID=UPI0015E5DF58|nr:HD domain-containing protein [Bombilactobacillus bombi]MBA1434643.1 HD domain-containing protein [Bombilactobacillus bombi]
MKIPDWRQDQQYLELVKDLLAKPELQRLQSIKQHHYSNRFDHSVRVSYYSYLLGKRWHLNTRALARGGLLHDLFYYDWDSQQMDFRTHAYVHAHIALNNAQKLTQLSPMEADIIVKHMFGATTQVPRYWESLIVSLVDDKCAVQEALSPKILLWKQKLQFK